MGHILYGYRKNERGVIEHRLFDSDELLHGSARFQGWYDSPDKVPGAPAIKEHEALMRADVAKTLGDRDGRIQAAGREAGRS